MEELVKEQPVYEIQKVKIKNNQLTGGVHGKVRGSKLQEQHPKGIGAVYPPRSTVRIEPA